MGARFAIGHSIIVTLWIVLFCGSETEIEPGWLLIGQIDPVAMQCIPDSVMLKAMLEPRPFFGFWPAFFWVHLMIFGNAQWFVIGMLAFAVLPKRSYGPLPNEVSEAD